MIKIGSLFAGIGGFELGLERAIPGSETIWQVEQNTFCQKVLAKHWPDAKIYNDVRNITKDNVEPIDILCGGFPCQDISLAGKGRGLHGEKSGLWWEMLRIISELRPRIIVMENVAAVLIRGGCEVVGSLAEIGYCTEWTVISARDMGACHLRRRWFAVAYSDERRKTDPIRARRQKSSLCTSPDSDSIRSRQTRYGELDSTRGKRSEIQCRRSQKSADSDSASCERERISVGVHKKNSNSDLSFSSDSDSESRKTNSITIELQKKYSASDLSFSKERYWGKTSPVSPLCRVDDGIPDRLDRLRALGNAIVPQCSEWVGQQIVKSGLLEDML